MLPHTSERVGWPACRTEGAGCAASALGQWVARWPAVPGDLSAAVILSRSPYILSLALLLRSPPDSWQAAVVLLPSSDVQVGSALPSVVLQGAPAADGGLRPDQLLVCHLGRAV